MNLLQQITQLLNDAPGNLVYHLVTLLAIQAVFAISWGIWQRDPDNDLAKRSIWASAGVFAIRLVWLLVSLIVSSNAAVGAGILPPLEQAVHTITAVLLVWALSPPSRRWPPIGNALAGLGVMVVIVMYIFFTQDWITQVGTGQSYNSTVQATIWGLAQMVILAVGLLKTIADRRYPPLNTLTIFLLLLAHVAHFWNYPELIPTTSAIPYWIRLGQLAVLPLWTAVAYRASLSPIIADPTAATDPQVLANILPLIQPVFSSLDEQDITRESVVLVNRLLPNRFVGIALLSGGDEVHLTSSLPQPGQNKPRQWQLPLDDLLALRTAITQRESVELLPDGPGARQYHAWHQTLKLPKGGPMLIQPIATTGEQVVGALVLTAANSQRKWRPAHKALVKVLTDLIGLSVENCRMHVHVLAEATAPMPMQADAETAVSGKLIALETERDELINQLETINARLVQAEAREAAALQRAHDLAQALQAHEETEPNQEIARLQAEIEALRESLIEAEEAMAMASAGEAGLSTEWVMMTITRYSGQLEAAQERIQQLEQALKRQQEDPENDILIALAQELRTPMTSIAGYTDLLLKESAGALGIKQREFLQKVKTNTERMNELLEQLVTLTTTPDKSDVQLEELVDLQEAIETAVSQVQTKIQLKNIQLDLNIEPKLPLLHVQPAELNQILTQLLTNACQVTPEGENVIITTQTQKYNFASNNGHGTAKTTAPYLQVVIQDKGPGIPTADLARVFRAHIHAEEPLVPGVSDTTAGLAVVRSLVEANGGRIWVDSAIGKGTNFTLLFPVAAEGGA